MPDTPYDPIAPPAGPVDGVVLDGDTVERLLGGRLDPDDAPPGYAEVARVLRAAAGPPCPDELAGQPAAMAAFRRSRRRARVRSRLVTVALAGTLTIGGLWIADGARAPLGVLSPSGGPGAGRSGSGAPAAARGRAGPGRDRRGGRHCRRSGRGRGRVAVGRRGCPRPASGRSPATVAVAPRGLVGRPVGSAPPRRPRARRPNRRSRPRQGGQGQAWQGREGRHGREPAPAGRRQAELAPGRPDASRRAQILPTARPRPRALPARHRRPHPGLDDLAAGLGHSSRPPAWPSPAAWAPFRRGSL